MKVSPSNLIESQIIRKYVVNHRRFEHFSGLGILVVFRTIFVPWNAKIIDYQ